MDTLYFIYNKLNIPTFKPADTDKDIMDDDIYNEYNIKKIKHKMYNSKNEFMNKLQF